MGRGRFFGRVLRLVIVLGLLWAATTAVFRSGYRQGFVQGAALASADGVAVFPPAVMSAGGGPGGLVAVAGAGLVALMLLPALGACAWRRAARHKWDEDGPTRHGFGPPHWTGHEKKTWERV